VKVKETISGLTLRRTVLLHAGKQCALFVMLPFTVRQTLHLNLGTWIANLAVLKLTMFCTMFMVRKQETV
jgi:hypothetical protein